MCNQVGSVATVLHVRAQPPGRRDDDMNSKQATELTILTGLVAMLLGWPALGWSSVDVCGQVYDPASAYPVLAGPSISGEAAIVVHIGAERASVDIDGCFYEIGGDVLEVDFGHLDEVRVFFELEGPLWGASVSVTDDSGWTEVHAVDDGSFVYVMSTESSLHFEVAAPGPLGPVMPLVIRKPIEEEPSPG